MTNAPLALDPRDLPDDPERLKAMFLAERRVRGDMAAEIERLQAIIAEFRRQMFGRKSEQRDADPDQLNLALEDVQQELAEDRAASDSENETVKKTRERQRRTNRGNLPKHLPREERVIEPENTACPCCGKAMSQIGEDVCERLDVIPAQFRVIVTRRPKYACRCGDKIAQAPAPTRLIPGGLPTEAMVAHVLVSKYADHLPLYRQTQILERRGVRLDRATLADWVGYAARELRPLHEHLAETLKKAERLYMDETRAPVLEPGRGRTKTGYLWAMVRDDRPWGGADPPGVVYFYADGRGARHPVRFLEGYQGVLQVDGYAAYGALADPNRVGGPVTLAYCWSHCRRKFYDLAESGRSPVAAEALRRFGEIYAIETEIRGKPAADREAVRRSRTRPLVEAFKPWLEQQLGKVSGKSRLAEAIRYTLSRWEGLIRFLDDGRLDLDTNAVERTMRPIALNRKNALFAGSDRGGDHWAVIASLIETCKLNKVDPFRYLTDVLERLVAGHRQADIDQLMPWAYAEGV